MEYKDTKLNKDIEKIQAEISEIIISLSRIEKKLDDLSKKETSHTVE